MPSVARIILGWFRFLFRPKSEMALKRLNICLPCKYRKGRFCSLCWCELDAKAEVEEEECDKGYW